MKQEDGMDKFGVDEEAHGPAEKIATAGNCCPSCGTSEKHLQKHGHIIICPLCGTEPFEKRK